MNEEFQEFQEFIYKIQYITKQLPSLWIQLHINYTTTFIINTITYQPKQLPSI